MNTTPKRGNTRLKLNSKCKWYEWQRTAFVLPNITHHQNDEIRRIPLPKKDSLPMKGEHTTEMLDDYKYDELLTSNNFDSDMCHHKSGKSETHFKRR